ncbi:MAG: PIN domain-containing protein [Rhizobium sp.]|nr:PIN domain-containing protein [Rhizobium sp.]
MEAIERFCSGPLYRSIWQDLHLNWRPNLTDEADNHVMELAVAANATMIVTQNVRDIIRPEQVIERMAR